MSGRNGMVDASNKGRASRGIDQLPLRRESWSGPARRAALSLALGLLSNRMAVAQAPLVLATSTPGGGLSTFADALLTELSGVKPALAFTPRHTAGSAENIRLLRTGAADVAIVAGETATNALAGENAPMVLAALYGTPVMFAVRGDSRTPGYRIAPRAAGSLGRQWLQLRGGCPAGYWKPRSRYRARLQAGFRKPDGRCPCLGAGWARRRTLGRRRRLAGFRGSRRRAERDQIHHPD